MAKKIAKKRLEPMDTYNRVEGEIRKFVAQGDCDRAIAHCEKQLKSLPKTDYHKVLGRDWLKLAPKASKWLVSFFKAAGKKLTVKAIYCEMNRFEINADEWHIDAFAYDAVESIDDFGWLCGWKHSNHKLRFVLGGMSDLQRLFARDYADEPPAKILAASELAILLLTLRMQQLIHAAAQAARKAGALPESVPVFAAAHETDLVFASVGKDGLRVTEASQGKVESPPPDAELPPTRPGTQSVYMLEHGWDSHGNIPPWDRMEFLSEDVEFRLEDKLCKAGPLAGKWRPPKVRIKKCKWRCDFFCRIFEHWAVNAKGKDAIADLVGDTVEFLPVKCVGDSTELFLIHPLLHVDLGPNADYERPEPGDNVTEIDKYSFDLREIEGKHMFRVYHLPGTPARKGGWAYREVMVSTQMKNRLVESGLRGIILEEVFNYRSPTSTRRKKR